jgi:hypothetical protein
VAHDEIMFSNYDFTRALVIDRQQRLHDEARRHRLAFGRRAMRAQATNAADQVSTVYHLPVRGWRTDGETRAAS